MYRTIVLAAALQQWERHSAHALAARDVAAGLARDAHRLCVLSVYEYDVARMQADGASDELMARLRNHEVEETDRLMTQKIDEYAAPLVELGLPVSAMLRVGSPRHVIVEVASEVDADLLVIGSHSKRALFDIALGDTARHVAAHAPCTVVMASARK